MRVMKGRVHLGRVERVCAVYCSAKRTSHRQRDLKRVTLTDVFSFDSLQ